MLIYTVYFQSFLLLLFHVSHMILRCHGKTAINMLFNMMYYISRDSRMSLQAVFNGFVNTPPGGRQQTFMALDCGSRFEHFMAIKAGGK